MEEDKKYQKIFIEREEREERKKIKKERKKLDWNGERK